jgi:hypothetical protein
VGARGHKKPGNRSILVDQTKEKKKRKEKEAYLCWRGHNGVHTCEHHCLRDFSSRGRGEVERRGGKRRGRRGKRES